MKNILCVDNDRYMAEQLRRCLTGEGFKVTITSTVHEMLRLVRHEHLDLIILTVDLHDHDGFQALTAVRALSKTPVIILASRGLEEDVITGLTKGADDYVVKPVNLQVLIMRVKAVLRRSTLDDIAGSATNDDGADLRIATALFNSRTNELTVEEQGTRIRLTPTEGRILQLLLTRPGRVISTARILESIWGLSSSRNRIDVSVVKTHVGHLRKKIAALPGNPHPIYTLPGVGYVACSTTSEAATTTCPRHERDSPAGS